MMKSDFLIIFESFIKLSVSGFQKTLKTGIDDFVWKGLRDWIWRRFLDTLGMDTGFFLALAGGRVGPELGQAGLPLALVRSRGGQDRY